MDDTFDPATDPAHNDDSQPSVTNSAQARAMADAVAAGTPLDAPPELDAGGEGDGLEELTNAELQDMLEERDLPTSGNKAELIERLRDAG